MIAWRSCTSRTPTANVHKQPDAGSTHTLLKKHISSSTAPETIIPHTIIPSYDHIIIPSYHTIIMLSKAPWPESGNKTRGTKTTDRPGQKCRQLAKPKHVPCYPKRVGAVVHAGCTAGACTPLVLPLPHLHSGHAAGVTTICRMK